MSKDDEIRLQHMLDAAREALSFARGRSREDLSTDRMFALAVVKEIEILGEAASRVSVETRSQHPQVPWQDISGMRHRLIHAYFDINLDIVWSTLRDDLPALISSIEQVVPGSTSPNEGAPR
jgi:uncharacterized protein with HEPN domain